MANSVQSPEKELRFTRSGQAGGFWVISAISASVAVTLLATSLYRGINPGLPHPAWALLPLIVSGVCVWLAVGLTRHAYLILTPLGIEIFPFFRPARGMRMVAWQEVAGVELSKRNLLTLHFDSEKTSGIHLSLKPIRMDRRGLLCKAVQGRVSGRSGSE